MIGCVVLWCGIAFAFVLYKKRKLPVVLEKKEIKYMLLILSVSNIVAMILFGTQMLSGISANEILRNSYGEGSKKEVYEVTVEGELENEPFVVEVEEQQYTQKETLEMFREMTEKLDRVILGENESFDRVEYDLNLVSGLEEYPAEIYWEINRYDLIDTEGHILEDYKDETGQLLELRGTIEYAEESAVYTATVMVYPKAKSEKEKWMDALSQMIQSEEEKTREQDVFVLPDTLDDREIVWEKSKDMTGFYIIALGAVAAALIPLKRILDKREAEKKRKEQMLLDYPEIVSTFTLLLGTGMTLKSAWKRVTANYEEEKTDRGKREAYEEMCFTYREIQGGIPEKEAYERFGERCGSVTYMKLGAMFSQNLRKGSKGLTELLEMESLQAFEERKSNAKRAGEEASTKLMAPMFAMLAVVLVMVVIPAFLSMQI